MALKKYLSIIVVLFSTSLFSMGSSYQRQRRIRAASTQRAINTEVKIFARSVLTHGGSVGSNTSQVHYREGHNNTTYLPAYFTKPIVPAANEQHESHVENTDPKIKENNKENGLSASIESDSNKIMWYPRPKIL